MRRIVRLLVIAAVLPILLAAPSIAHATTTQSRCVKTYTRTDFHNIAGHIFDGRDRATARERAMLHRVIRCQRYRKSMPLVRLHLHRYREHHRVELHARSMGVRGIAWLMLRHRGMLDQFVCLDQLVSHESGWDPFSTNSSSGAYGLPQALPGSKMAAAGADWRTNPATQLRWLIFIYVTGRYGTLCNAWAWWQAHRWY